MVKESYIKIIDTTLNEEELKVAFDLILAQGWELIQLQDFRGLVYAVFTKDKIEA